MNYGWIISAIAGTLTIFWYVYKFLSKILSQKAIVIRKSLMAFAPLVLYTYFIFWGQLAFDPYVFLLVLSASVCSLLWIFSLLKKLYISNLSEINLKGLREFEEDFLAFVQALVGVKGLILVFIQAWAYFYFIYNYFLSSLVYWSFQPWEFSFGLSMLILFSLTLDWSKASRVLVGLISGLVVGSFPIIVQTVLSPSLRIWGIFFLVLYLSMIIIYILEFHQKMPQNRIFEYIKKNGFEAFLEEIDPIEGDLEFKVPIKINPNTPQDLRKSIIKLLESDEEYEVYSDGENVWMARESFVIETDKESLENSKREFEENANELGEELEAEKRKSEKFFESFFE